MPYCPKCGCEYKPGYDTCADCGSTLVAEDPNAPIVRARPPVSAVTVVELTVTALVAPWFVYPGLVAVGLFTAELPFGSPVIVTAALTLCTWGLIAAVMAYGRWRRDRISALQLVLGWVIGSVLHTGVLVAISFLRDVSPGIVVWFFLAPVLSLLAMLLVAFGSALPRRT